MKQIICKLEEYTNYKIKILLFTKQTLVKELVHAKNSILEKRNVTWKFDATNIAPLRKALK